MCFLVCCLEYYISVIIYFSENQFSHLEDEFNNTYKLYKTDYLTICYSVLQISPRLFTLTL